DDHAQALPRAVRGELTLGKRRAAEAAEGLFEDVAVRARGQGARDPDGDGARASDEGVPLLEVLAPHAGEGLRRSAERLAVRVSVGVHAGGGAGGEGAIVVGERLDARDEAAPGALEIGRTEGGLAQHRADEADEGGRVPREHGAAHADDALGGGDAEARAERIELPGEGDLARAARARAEPARVEPREALEAARIVELAEPHVDREVDERETVVALDEHEDAVREAEGFALGLGGAHAASLRSTRTTLLRLGSKSSFASERSSGAVRARCRSSVAKAPSGTPSTRSWNPSDSALPRAVSKLESVWNSTRF